jgi:hypothetical protein
VSDVLGVDIGGVICAGDTDGQPSFFSGRWSEVEPVSGAFEAVTILNGSGSRFFENVHLVSKCGEKIEKKTREWLALRDFVATTGVPAERLHFCRDRQGKAEIAKSLGITHFIDDRLEVLSYLATVPHLYLFRGREDEIAKWVGKWKDGMLGIHQVDNWKQVLALLGFGGLS